ncbi:MAG: SpoIIE family protein phosphatase [Bacteroidales bacterium]|jgi:serine/threonine protein phosphatase PrpC|nr:SpoIIE family protein phosphatase [Bacteroidales bacterium]
MVEEIFNQQLDTEVITQKYHVEVGQFQCNHTGEKICGDVFLSRRLPDEKRVLCVLSDGMGHGVRANVLATLTATISLNFTLEHKDANAIAAIIMKALPICSERGISYSTFTIVDIMLESDCVSILEYDNPQTIIMRGSQIYAPQWTHVKYEGDETDKRVMDLKTVSFTPQLEDRILFCSDGIVQSGMGKGITMGWGRNNLIKFVREIVEDNADVSATDLSEMVVKQAIANDLHAPKDDLTCGVVYFRQPRKILLCTGPPFSKDKDHEFALLLKHFEGKKIISGATTTEIISRELEREVIDEDITDPTLPPSSKMSGVDLVTEGVLTLSKVINLLEAAAYGNKIQLGKGPADRVCKMLLESDEIHILVGTKINESHHDPNLPVEIEIRKHLIRRLTQVLEDKFMKVINIKYM